MQNSHAHVTLASPCRTAGWKKTNIILLHYSAEKDRCDRMLTRHFRDMSVPQICAAITEQFRGINILRVKIEQTDGQGPPISKQNYIEIHMLCRDGVIPRDSGWVKSRNPRRRLGEYFYTKRVYEGESLLSVKNRILCEQGGVKYTEIRFEQVVYDSCASVDDEWINGPAPKTIRKRHPLHDDEYCWNAVSHHSVADWTRRTGRTTAIALMYIAMALASPGKEFQLKDHHDSWVADKLLMDKVLLMLERLELAHFKGRRDMNAKKCFIKFGE